MKNKKLYLVLLLVLLFIINTILVVNHSYNIFDNNVHNFIFSINSNLVTNIMKFITFFGSTVFIVILSIFLFVLFLIIKNRKEAITSASLIIISTIINNVVKLIIRRPRPEYILVIEKSFSYPSGHMMASTTLYGFLIYLIGISKLNKTKKHIFQSLLLVFILLIGISRIYLGAHFFSDVLGAAILSTIILLTFSVINDKKKII